MKTITEQNALIAEFMGAILEPSGSYYFLTAGRYYHPNAMKYHESWDWLMPCVQKCYTIDNEERFDALSDAVSTLSITATFEAVVEFIEWSNLNK